jgi:hypothetical protein
VPVYSSLRGWRPQGREGSSPFFRTNIKARHSAGLCALRSA